MGMTRLLEPFEDKREDKTMAMCSFAERFSMFDVTPLENLFIEEYMLRAPGDFVKVYIYGLRLCYHPVAEATVLTVSRALGLEEKTVEDAFAYWERQGLLRRTGDKPPTYAYYNLKDVMLTRRDGAQEEISPAERSFNTALQDLFGTRLLQAQEYERVYKWMDDFHFSKDVVLLLVKHCIAASGKGTQVTFASIEKEALRWAKHGATTRTAAEDYLRTLSAHYEGAQRVLRQYGLRRAPTVDEEALYAKWSQQWGFSLDAILYACRETTKISQPNFAYLDKVLENLHRQQLSTRADIAGAAKARTDVMRPVREVLDALGAKGVSPTEDLAMVYASWLKMGFSHEAVLRAARYTVRMGSGRIEDVSVRLKIWARDSLFTAEAIDAHLARRRQSIQHLSALFEAAGITRAPTPSDIKLLEGWSAQGFGLAALLVAAESARGANNPMLYMGRVLESWAAKGVFSPEDARAEQERHAQKPQSPAATAPAPSRPSKEVGAHRFGQRAYTDEELDSLLYTDLDDLSAT